MSRDDDDEAFEALVQEGDQYSAPAIVSPHLSRLDQLRAALLTSAALDSLPEPLPLINDWLYQDGLVWLHGKRASGKSFVALDMAGCVACGIPWHGRLVAESAVLYVYLEGVPGLKQRVRAWESSMGMDMKVTFLPAGIRIIPDAAPLGQIAVDMGAKLVVIDTQARAASGLDENSSKDMSLLVDAADSIRAVTGACVMLVHHEPRNADNPRGSTAIEGAASTLIRAEKDGDQVTLSNTKQKDAPEQPQCYFRLVPAGQSAVIVESHRVSPDFGQMGTFNDSETTLLTAMRDCLETGEGASVTRLMEVSGLTKATFYRAKKHLVEAGKICNIGTVNSPRYCLVALGQQMLQSHEVSPSLTQSHDHGPGVVSVSRPIGTVGRETETPGETKTRPRP